jgi:UDP-N-acetylmuramoyl-tripeptide--D-alanyl-D-alanine ligase
MRWSVESLAEATQGVLSAELLGEDPIYFDSVSTDTRSLKSGALYVAINGVHFDGHEFIDQAVQQGAVAVLISEPMSTVVPAVLVEDTRIALGQLAEWHRQQKPLKKLIGITGSNGKTTTKSLLAHILNSVAPTLATAGNLNNDFGVPRTLLEINTSHQYAVIEMGANHIEEIRYLTQMAHPDIALITNAAGAHLEGFGSLEGVIQGKGEIFEGLSEEGVGVINLDSPGANEWLEKCQKLQKQVVTFGRSDHADYQLVDYQADPVGSTFQVRLNQQEQIVRTFRLPLFGEHNAMNAVAVIVICDLLELTCDQIRSAMASFNGVGGRLQRQNLPNGVLLDDSYNANPESVRAAIDTLSSMGGSACICLGDMAELGVSTTQAHKDVAAYAKALGVKEMFAIGKQAEDMVEAFGIGGRCFQTHHALAQTVVSQIRNQQVNHVLVKGSRSAQMEQVVSEIMLSL